MGEVSVTDRTGQVWEFDDGLLLLITRTSAARFNINMSEHDVLVLVEGDDDDRLTFGKRDTGWLEINNHDWDKRLKGRKRIA